MPRPVSWLSRPHEINRTVSNSVRFHYGRGDIERLFELQPRAAGKLLEMLPTLRVGTSRLVDPEVLLGFLGRVRDADDTATLFEEVRKENAPVSRKKVRTLVRRDLSPVSLDALPELIALSRGRVELSFATVEQLAEDLFKLAQLLTKNVEEFARAFEPEPPPPETGDAVAEMREHFAELDEWKGARNRSVSSSSRLRAERFVSSFPRRSPKPTARTTTRSGARRDRA